MSAVRIALCAPCARKLQRILEERGVSAMGEAVGRVLCGRCRRKVPGYEPGRRLVTQAKPRPS